MRKRFRWTALWMVAVLLVAACSNTGGEPIGRGAERGGVGARRQRTRRQRTRRQ